MLTTQPSDEIRAAAAAAAIAHLRITRMGGPCPPVDCILEMMPKRMAEEALEDAAAALEAVEQLRSQKAKLAFTRRQEWNAAEKQRDIEDAKDA